jgi:uncharacterized protein Yka (UPF0111/DUF47 family)
MSQQRADKLYELSQAIKKLEAEADAIKTELKKELAVGIHTFGERQVTVTEVTRETLNKILVKALLDPAAFKGCITSTNYLSIAVK